MSRGEEVKKGGLRPPFSLASDAEALFDQIDAFFNDDQMGKDGPELAVHAGFQFFDTDFEEIHSGF